jgi:hypothetical protein
VKETTPWGPNRTLQADYQGISTNINWEKIVESGKEKEEYPAGQCRVCAAHKKME